MQFFPLPSFPRKRESSANTDYRRWIPAFAGMTGKTGMMMEARMTAEKTSGAYSWHQQQQQHCLSLIQSHRLPHALLLWGIKGLGKYHFAERLSHYLLCEKPDTVAMRACADCISCHWLSAGTHPDYLVIRPEGSASIRVEAIRQIQAFAVQKSHAGQYRIILIEPAEKMNLSAANALLKILEEPFENTLFLLVSHHISAVLPTIKSRCQKLYFQPLDFESFKKIPEYQSYSLAEQESLFLLSQGAPKRFSDEKIILQHKEKFFSIMNALFSKTYTVIDAVSQLQKIEKEADMDFEQLLDWMLIFTHQTIIYTEENTRDLWECNIIPEYSKRGRGAAQPRVRSVYAIHEHARQAATKYPFERRRVYRFYDKLLLMKQHLQDSANINPGIWLEDACLIFNKEVQLS